MNNRKKANGSLAATFSMLLLFIFITAMTYPANNNKPYTLLSLGDSYTIGEMVPSEENFPNQVRRLLNQKGLATEPPRIIAKTGWTTDELQDAINKEQLSPRYDFVTLLIGVNNQYRGRSATDYAPEFESLLQQAIRFAGNRPSHVIVLSIPDWGVTPFAKERNSKSISREIDAFNRINKQLSDRYHVNYIDITPGTRLAATDSTLLTADGLHPSGKEYTKWAGQVADAIEKNL